MTLPQEPPRNGGRRAERIEPHREDGLFLVLASRGGFEALSGPIPGRFETCFRFAKPNETIRIETILPDCRLVISKSYLPPPVHRWIFEARRRGIPTLLLVDGPLEWSNVYHSPSLRRRMGPGQAGLFEPIIHDAVAGIGSAQIRWIGERNAGRGIELMTYSNHRIRTRPDPTREPKRDEELDFLVTTARKPYFGEAQRQALLRCLIDACDALSAGGHRYALRVFDRPLLRSLRRRRPDVRVDSTESFTRTLARTACVIGTPSSVLLEAMQHGKPTGTLIFRDTPLFYQTGWLLGGTSDWRSSLESMLSREPERMEFQTRVLRENLSDHDFFAHCDRIRDEEVLTRPRPIDAADIEFENRSLRLLLGWRARLLLPLLRRR
jgi:hypothetical protein